MSVGAWCGNCIDYFWILRVIITRWVWVWRTFDDNATQTKKSFAKSATWLWLPHLFLQTHGYVSCNTNNHPPPSFPRSCCAFALLFSIDSLVWKVSLKALPQPQPQPKPQPAETSYFWDTSFGFCPFLVNMAMSRAALGIKFWRRANKLNLRFDIMKG